MALLTEYHRPATLTEAVSLLNRRTGNLIALAGGTKVIGMLETNSRRNVEGVVDLRNLRLDFVHAHDGYLHVGAMTTLSAIVAHEIGGTLADGLLRRAARGEGPVNLRNVATAGGVVACADYDSEFYTALLAFDATVTMHNGITETTRPLAKLNTLSGLITEIRIPLHHMHGGHARIARTPSDRPIVAALAVSGPDVEQVALCGVGPKPLLNGTRLNPPDDYKGSAHYRQVMASIVKERALAEARKVASES